jgi:UDP-N-acetylglucosamine:LPS N-acetylglucosamine transferase
MNTKFLLGEGVAVKAECPDDAAMVLGELLYNTDKLAVMRRKALSLARPSSSVDIARLVLELC